MRRWPVSLDGSRSPRKPRSEASPVTLVATNFGSSLRPGDRPGGPGPGEFRRSRDGLTITKIYPRCPHRESMRNPHGGPARPHGSSCLRSPCRGHGEGCRDDITTSRPRGHAARLGRPHSTCPSGHVADHHRRRRAAYFAPRIRTLHRTASRLLGSRGFAVDHATAHGCSPAIAVAHTQALVRSPRTPRCSTVLHGAPRCPGGTPPVVHPVPRRPGLVRPGPREPCY